MPFPSPEQLAGFENPRRAERELTDLADRVGVEVATEILALASGSFDPDALIASFDRIREGLEPSVVRPLASLFQASDFLPRVLAARPGLIRWLRGSRSLERPKPLERFLREARAAVRTVPPGDRDLLLHRLRRYKYREVTRLLARDVLRAASMEELGREQSHLAQALLGAAFEACHRELIARYGLPPATSVGSPGFSVLGLGKLGGEDLNFSSDIDLIYLYREEGETSGGTSGPLSCSQYYSRLAEALTQAIGAHTGDGFCFRVDLNLRPQGRSGAIVLSLAAASGYYETYGRTWERAALLKARCVAGDASLAAELLDGLAPFIWRRSLDLSAVDELRELKAQIDLRGKASASDVKLGPGGIREIEFFANALQLMHGGKHPALRERSTLKSLRKLEQAGLIAAPDADALEEAYLFLRRLENRLQMVDERQTQALPSSERDLLRLARSLGYVDAPALLRELDRHRRFVHEAFSTLLGRTARDLVPDEPELALALDIDAPEADRRAALARRGFESPERALAALERLARVPDSPFGLGASRPSLLGIKLLAEIARTPDPDQALLHFSEFLGQLRAPQGYLSLITSAPLAGRRLLNLFGQSDYLSRYFLRHPELLDALVQGGLDEAHKPPERLRQELASRVHRHADPEDRLTAMRRFKNEEVLRIGLDDIAGELPVPAVAEQLTAIAEGVIDEALFLAQAEQTERYGLPQQQGRTETLLVIGMGKLGGHELGYHSDLDLIFVYSGQGEQDTSGGSRGRITHHEFFAKVVQRLITFLQLQLREGLLYKVDTRLRPSGNQGPLVVGLEALREHHEKRAQLWQRQALIKARGVGGDLSLFERVRESVIVPLVYERPLPESAAAEIDRLRQRMERELGRETEDELNPKLGHGGLVDIEFATQYFQLVHGRAHPEVRVTGTLMALSALGALGCVPGADVAILHQGYLFHRRVENRLRLLHGHSLEALPTRGRPLARLARRLGYLGADPGQAFLAEYRAYTERVRAVYARALGRA